MKERLLKHKGYQGSVECSLEDNVLHGKILHINDLVTYEAKTLEDLRNEFVDAVDDYLEMCEEEGISPDKPMTGNFNVRIGESLHRRLVLEANERNKSQNDTIKFILKSWFEQRRLTVNHLHVHEHRLVSEFGEGAFTGSVKLERGISASNPKVVRVQ